MITPERWAVYYDIARKCYVIDIDGRRNDLSRAELAGIRDGAKYALAQGESYDGIPDTERPPPEPPTSPGTKEARRRSSDKLQAVPQPTGLAARVDAIFRGEEDPPKSSP